MTNHDDVDLVRRIGALLREARGLAGADAVTRAEFFDRKADLLDAIAESDPWLAEARDLAGQARTQADQLRDAAGGGS
jgi:hypothetical protein